VAPELDEEKRPLIVEVKGNSLDDGPGIRTVIFFKGCPLDCDWCHNPEGKTLGAALSFDRAECVGARDCIAACKDGALDPRAPDFVDRAKCTLCFDCVDACPSRALDRVGRPLDVSALVETIQRNEPFYRASGGGVTLSGGEPTLYMDDVSELLRALKARGIHTLLETCGHFALDRYRALIEPFVDQVYFDLKIIDDSDHAKYCGKSNRLILDNFRALMHRSRNGGPALLPRIPLIPDRTVTAPNLKAIAAFLSLAGAREVALLPYNPLWISKASKLGRRPSALPTSFLSPEEISWARSFFAGFAIR
jgi:pyruvate formate lyase activating enzyme